MDRCVNPEVAASKVDAVSVPPVVEIHSWRCSFDPIATVLVRSTTKRPRRDITATGFASSWCDCLSNAMELRSKVMCEWLTDSCHPQRVPKRVTVDGEVSFDDRHLLGG